MCNGKCKDPDDTYDLADDPPEDIQHDLAMSLASAQGETVIGIDAKIIDELTAELKRRGEPLPINCRWEHDPYAPFGKKLCYDLEEQNKRNVRCVLACVNASGEGEFVPVKVRCTAAQYDLGDHYGVVKEWAKEQGYEAPYVVVDEVEIHPTTVLQAFDWDNVPVIGVSDATF